MKNLLEPIGWVLLGTGGQIWWDGLRVQERQSFWGGVGMCAIGCAAVLIDRWLSKREQRRGNTCQACTRPLPDITAVLLRCAHCAADNQLLPRDTPQG